MSSQEIWGSNIPLLYESHHIYRIFYDFQTVLHEALIEKNCCHYTNLWQRHFLCCDIIPWSVAMLHETPWWRLGHPMSMRMVVLAEASWWRRCVHLQNMCLSHWGWHFASSTMEEASVIKHPPGGWPVPWGLVPYSGLEGIYCWQIKRS